MEFEIALCKNGERVIAKIYKFLLKFEVEEGQIKECMITSAKNFIYNIQMHRCEKMWLKELTFLLYYNIRVF